MVYLLVVGTVINCIASISMYSHGGATGGAQIKPVHHTAVLYCSALIIHPPSRSSGVVALLLRDS